FFHLQVFIRCRGFEAVDNPADSKQQQESDDVNDPAGKRMKEPVGDAGAVIMRKNTRAAHARGVGQNRDGHRGKYDDHGAPKAETFEPAKPASRTTRIV